MLFSTIDYIIIFLPVLYILFSILRTTRPTSIPHLLIAASIVFYISWDLYYCILFILILIINYFFGLKLIRKKSKLTLSLAIIIDLIPLGYFKYSQFLLENTNYLFNTQFEISTVILPLGISFYTFQLIAFLCDCYYKTIKEDVSFKEYALFGTFFPQLIAGPIVHFNEIRSYFTTESFIKFCHANISKSIALLAIGLFKKLVIADNLGLYVDYGYSNLSQLSQVDAWLVTFAYSFQIYFDFSGYTDIALGTAGLFNIKLPHNFNSPYKSTNIQEFWRRWNITLGQFLRDYIYIPLGGNRKGPSSTLINFLAVFFIAGLWHGASWLFIIWGMIHGIAISAHFLFKKFIKLQIPNLIGQIICFIFVTLTWILFCTSETAEAKLMLTKLFIGDDYRIDSELLYLSIILPLLLTSIYLPNSNEISDKVRHSKFYIIITAFALCISYCFLMYNDPSNDFIYWQF